MACVTPGGMVIICGSHVEIGARHRAARRIVGAAFDASIDNSAGRSALAV